MLAARRVACACVAAAALALTGGCATVLRGVTQDVQIATDPAGAACELRAKDGKVLDAIDITPGYVRLRKGLEGYTVACRRNGYLDATTALEMMGPIPGTLMRRSQPASCRAIVSISRERVSMRSSRRRQSPARSSMTCSMRGDSMSVREARINRQLGTQEADALAHGDAALFERCFA